METNLESLESLARKIRQECKALDDNAAAWHEGKLEDGYLAGHFSYVEALFEQFQNRIPVEQDDALETIVQGVDEVYRHVCVLKAATQETEEETEPPEQPEDSEPDEPDEEQERMAQEDAPTDPEKQKRKSRTVRRPAALTRPDPDRTQQEQWQKAAALGMAPLPGQVITESQIQQFQADRQQGTADAQTAAQQSQSHIQQLEQYRADQEELASRESIGSSHINMGRELFGAAETVDTALRQQGSSTAAQPLQDHKNRADHVRRYREYQQRLAEGHDAGASAGTNRREPPRSVPLNQGYTKADAAAARASMDHHRYTLNAVMQRYGRVSYVMFSQGVQRAVGRLENDTIRGLSTGAFYVRGALGAASLFSARPTAEFERSARRITAQELTEKRRGVIRQQQELRSQISKLEHQLSGLSGGKKPAQLRQAESLREQLKQLRNQMPMLQRELRGHDWVQRVQHRQALDQQLVKELTVGKRQKIPSKAKNLQELSRSILKKREEKIAHRYGKQCNTPTNQISRQIRQLKEHGGQLKKQLRLLEGKKILTVQERRQLLHLRQQLKDHGRQIAALQGLKRDRQDLAYVQDRIGRILQKAGKRRQKLIGTSLLAKNLALRPFHPGTESNTEWVQKSVSFATDPRTVRYTKKAVSGTAKLTGKAFHFAAPSVDNWIRYQAAQQKAAAKSAVKSVKQSVKKEIPGSVKKAAHTAAAPVRKAQQIGTGIHNRAYAAKRWLGNTRIGMWVQRQHYRLKAAGDAVRAVLTAGKALLVKGLAIFAAVYLVAGVVAGTAGLLASGMSSTVITSPQIDSSGKIDLSPYVRIVKNELSSFNHQMDSLRKSYEDDPAYDNVEVIYSGTNNNMRQILSMMAVRMQQDLDMGENPDVEPYLKYLVNISHTYDISEHHYSCDGCEVRWIPEQVYDPVTGVIETVYRKEIYCPGHIDVTIRIDVLSSQQLIEQDAYQREDDWTGWDEENLLRYKTIYEMDWAEIYSGTGIGHGSTIGTVISAADEAKIWQYLRTMTGNPFGAAGLMGNLYAESGLVPTNLENGYEELLGYDDAGYTHAVDSGSYENFTGDWAGYGLAQWTDPTRKNRLLKAARSKGVSIGDLNMQLAYLQEELSNSSILFALQQAISIREASDEVLVNFERPADQSEGVKRTRASFGEYFYNKYELGVESEGHLTQKQMDVIRVATNSELYGVPAEKGMCQAWAALVYGAAGLEVDGSCCAYHSGMAYGVSDDWSAVPPGAAVYGYAGNQYGHVGIYVGNGLVYHNIGGVAVDTLEDWIRIYDGFVWGWQAGQDLTK